MRVAYVGISSPTAYLYGGGGRPTKRSKWSWSPIIECPQGLATLFDEVWFLHPALCPATMMNLDFVRFLNQDPSKRSIIKPLLENPDRFLDAKVSELLDSRNAPSPIRKMPDYSKVIDTITGWPKDMKRYVDNHSLNFQFSEVHLRGNSSDSHLLILDFAILERLRETADSQIELVLNRFTESMLAQVPATLPEMQIAGGIVVKRIPSVLRPEGPDMSRIYSLRDNVYLSDFRKKICQSAANQENEDILEIAERIEHEYEDYKHKVLLEKHKEAQVIESFSRNAASIMIGLLLPVPGLKEAAVVIEARRTRRMNWTAFISSIEMKRS